LGASSTSPANPISIATVIFWGKKSLKDVTEMKKK
jgi:hypothetical protein